MKRMILLAMALVVFSVQFAFAEASFDQIQELIKQQNYSAAISGLEGIIKNHPKSAKAFYAMSQAQAGIGNQVKAKEALDIATGIDPSLKFASSGNVEKLKEAITPQTKNIQAIESHTGRNILIVLLLLGGGIGAYFLFRKKETLAPLREPEPSTTPVYNAKSPEPYSFQTNDSPMHNSASMMARVVDTKTVAPESDVLVSKYERQRPTYRPATPAPVHRTTVVHSNNSGSDMLTGVLVGSMLNSSHHDHHETRVVEREVVRETPSYSAPEREERSSSWDTPKAEERSSSWDSPSETKSSSSWDSSSDSSSSSSWSSSDSSSSSDSGSSSSWD